MASVLASCLRERGRRLGGQLFPSKYFEYFSVAEKFHTLQRALKWTRMHLGSEGGALQRKWRAVTLCQLLCSLTIIIIIVIVIIITCFLHHRGPGVDVKTCLTSH